MEPVEDGVAGGVLKVIGSDDETYKRDDTVSITAVKALVIGLVLDVGH